PLRPLTWEGPDGPAPTQSRQGAGSRIKPQARKPADCMTEKPFEGKGYALRRRRRAKVSAARFDPKHSMLGFFCADRFRLAPMPSPVIRRKSYEAAAHQARARSRGPGSGFCGTGPGQLDPGSVAGLAGAARTAEAHASRP